MIELDEATYKYIIYRILGYIHNPESLKRIYKFIQSVYLLSNEGESDAMIKRKKFLSPAPEKV